MKTRTTFSYDTRVLEEAEKIVKASKSKYSSMSHYANLALIQLNAHEKELEKGTR